MQQLRATYNSPPQQSKRKSRPLLAPCLTLTMLLMMMSCHTPKAKQAEQLMAPVLLTDFSTDLAKDDRNATISLRFFDIREMPNGLFGDVMVQLQRRDGKWSASGHFAAADYNQRSENAVTIETLTYEAGKLQGKLNVSIGSDHPRPIGSKSQHLGPQPFPPLDEGPDVYTIEIDAKLLDEAAPYITDSEKHEPPWRKDMRMFGGQHIAGRFTASREDVVTKGEIIGALNPSGMQDTWVTGGNIHIKPAAKDGIKVFARLSPTPVMSFGSARATKRFSQIQDWSAYDTMLITVESPKRRNDVAVFVEVTPEEGGSKRVSSAAPLLGDEHTFAIPLHRLTTRSGKVKALSFGVSNLSGVGDVAFTVRKIELATHADRKPFDPNKDNVNITLHPDHLRIHNGEDTIPKGLFGMHSVGWAKDADEGVLAYHRQINAGSIRPIDHVGFGGERMSAGTIAEARQNRLSRDEPTDKVYQLLKASNSIDNTVWCHTQDLFSRPQWMDQGIKRWEEKVADFYHNLAAKAWVPGDKYNYLRRFEVWNEPFFWGRHMNMNHRLPAGKKDWEDESQFGYIPGKLGADVYSRFFLAAVKSGKAVNEHVEFGGPSSPSFNGSNYTVFTNYVSRFIDKTIDHVDFLTEHHYGGNPSSYAASYEISTAYTDIKFGRRIPVYNTEANNLGASAAGKAAYNIEDILAGIIVNPDIYRARALHALWWGKVKNEGELHAYTALNTLRGKMLVIDSSSSDVQAVAALNEDGQIVVAAFNRSWYPKTLDFEVAGKGATVQEALMLLADAPTNENQLRDPEGQAIPAPPEGKTSLVDLDPKTSEKLTLPPRSMMRWTLKPNAQPATRRVKSEQSFINTVFKQIKPGFSFDGKVNWQGKLSPKEADSAVLRVVTSDVHDGEAIVSIGSKTYTLPYSDGNPEGNEVQTIPIDHKLLTEDVTINFSVRDPKTQNGYQILSASIMLTKTK